jgi:tetratricopeptide (TPR) repeat protein
VEIQRMVAEGWSSVAAGQQEGGLALLRQASEREAKSEKHPVTPGWLAPARELYAEALLEAGQPAAALAEFEQVLTTEPNRFRAEAGAGRAAAAAGDAEVARRHYARLLEIAAQAQSARPELVAARQYLAQR